MCGGCVDGRCGVGRQILFRWCRVGPCLDAARPLEEVRDAGRVAGGTLPVPPLPGLPDGLPTRWERLRVAVLPVGEHAGCGVAAGWWRGCAAERPDAHRGNDGDE